MFNKKRIQGLENKVADLTHRLNVMSDDMIDLFEENELLKQYFKLQIEESISLKKIVKKK